MSARVDTVRQRVNRRGLRLVKRGNTFDLRDGDTSLHSGSLNDVEAYLVAHCPWRSSGGVPKPGFEVPPQWAGIIDDYMLTLAAGGQPSTTMTLRRMQLVKMARDLGGDPADVTAEKLVAWFGSQPQWKIETRRNYRAGVRGFFRWAYQTKRIPDHIADELPIVRERRGVPRPAPDRVWREALIAAGARTTPMLRLAGEVGMRRGEVACVHTRDLLEGVDGSQLLVHGKGQKQRVVPISDLLAEAIRQGASGHTAGASPEGWLFPNGTGGHLTAHYVGELVVDLLPDHWTMHTLRHRFSSRAYRGTRNLRAVQVLLGHASIATTERYCAVDDSEIRAAMVAAAFVEGA
jgi:integrase/recombinase XerC